MVASAAALSSDIFLVSFLLPHSAPLGAVLDHFDLQMPAGSFDCHNFWLADSAEYRSFLAIDHWSSARCWHWRVGSWGFRCYCLRRAFQHLDQLELWLVRFGASANWRSLDSLARSWDSCSIMSFLVQCCSERPAVTSTDYWFPFTSKLIHQPTHSSPNSWPLKPCTVWHWHSQFWVWNS